MSVTAEDTYPYERRPEARPLHGEGRRHEKGAEPDVAARRGFASAGN